MAGKRNMAEETISHLRTIEIELGKGLGGVDAGHTLGMTSFEGGLTTGGRSTQCRDI